MGGEEDGRRWGLVDLAALDTDEAVFDVVDAADTVLTTKVVQALDEGDGVEGIAIDGRGEAFLESDLDVDAFGGGLSHS